MERLASARTTPFPGKTRTEEKGPGPGWQSLAT